MAQRLSQSFGANSNAQKYMLKSAQEEVLRRRLSLQVPSAPITASSPEIQSLSTSPTFSRPIYSSTWSPTVGYASTSPIPIHPGTTPEHDDVHDEDPNTMGGDINQRIKATLTELLNTESVRSDEKYRAWIQERLLDAERKIRRQRRRRSSNPNGEELATSIAEHIEYHTPPCRSWT